MHEKRTCCGRDNGPRTIGVMSIAMIAVLSLLWMTVLVLAVQTAPAIYGTTAQSHAGTADDVVVITNETLRLARQQRRQQEEARIRNEEEVRRFFANLRPAEPIVYPNFRPARGITDGIATGQRKTSRGRTDEMVGIEDELADIDIHKELENIKNQYAGEREILNTYLVRMVKLYGVEDAAIGFIAVWLIVLLTGLVICEFLRWLIRSFCSYVINHLV